MFYEKVFTKAVWDSLKKHKAQETSLQKIIYQTLHQAIRIFCAWDLSGVPSWCSRLRLWAPNARGTSWIPGWGTEILHATSCGQKGKNKEYFVLKRKGEKKRIYHTSKLNLQPKHHAQFSFALKLLLWGL